MLDMLLKHSGKDWYTGNMSEMKILFLFLFKMFISNKPEETGNAKKPHLIRLRGVITFLYLARSFYYYLSDSEYGYVYDFRQGFKKISLRFLTFRNNSG